MWAVIGRNGSGKTTFLRTLLGLLSPVRGQVRFQRPKLRFAYLAQRQTYDALYPLLVHDVVALGLDRGSSFLRPRPRDSAARVRRALDLLGAGELEWRPFQRLSEGQKQRVLFARVAAAEPDLAVLDEPTSAMDRVAEREAFELLGRLREEAGLTLVIVSHYLGLAREYADQALLLERELSEVVVGTPAEVLRHPVFLQRYGTDRPAAP
jgi:zinc transport system ATP-binding protein